MVDHLRIKIWQWVWPVGKGIVVSEVAVGFVDMHITLPDAMIDIYESHTTAASLNLVA